MRHLPLQNVQISGAHPQYIGIDILRFLAALMVMLFHLVYLSSARQGTSYWISGGLISLPQAWSYTYWGWVGVQIFFVISGFVIALTAERSTPFSFIQSRVVKLGPGVWICAPLTFLVAALLWGDYRSWGLLRSVLFIPYGPWVEVVYWTLGIEVSFYSAVFLLVLYQRLSLLRSFGIFLGSISTLFWVTYALSSFSSQTPLFLIMHELAESRLMGLLLIHHGCEFAIGILIWQNLKDTPLKMLRSHLWLGIFAVGACLQIAAHNADENARVVHKFSALTPVLVWLATIVFLQWSVAAKRFSTLPAMLGRFSRRLGLMTYPLYLIHLTLGAYVMGVLARRHLPSGLAAMGGISFSLAVSWFISVYLEPRVQQFTKHMFLAMRGRRRWSANEEG